VLWGPRAETSPNLTSESVWFSCLENLLSLGQKSLATSAGLADPTIHRLAAAREEHCLDNRYALHATGTTRHS
jgi:hypothetical protein